MKAKVIAQICGVAVLAIGISVLCGWIFDKPLWRSLFPGFVEMKANTSIGYILSGISLICLAWEKRNAVTDRLGFGAAALMTLLGGATFLQYLFHIDLGIDTLLFYEAPGAVGTAYPGRMASASAMNFIFKGVALLTLDWETKNGQRPSQYLSIISMVAPLHALLAYSYGVRNVLGEGYVLMTQMAIHAAIAWLLLSVGTLLAIPDRGVMAIITNPSYAGVTVRRLLVPGIVIPIVLGLLLSYGFNDHLFSAGFGFSVMALTSVVFYTGLLWWNAKRLLVMEGEYGAEMEKSGEQIRQLQKMEAIGSLAGGVAHDFNNILGAIGLFNESVEYDIQEPEKVRSNLKQIQKAVDRGAALTRQLLAFSRQQEVVMREIFLHKLITGLERMLKPLLGEIIEFKSELKAPADSIVGNHGQIEQILMNLAVNARDAMPSGGKLTVSTEVVSLSKGMAENGLEIPPGGYLVMTVSDTGLGMTKEVQSRIFDPFYTTKPVGKGTGLGLSTVYGIVKKHGGSIMLSSEPGQGSSFRIYFPLSSQGSSEVIHSEVQEVIRTAEPANVMICEDEEALRTVMSEMLKMYNYNCISAVDGLDALRKLETYQGTLDLVITDVVMPKMGGRDLAAHLNARWPGIRILFISGYLGDIHADLEGNSHFLQKPFTGKDFILKVQSILAE